MHGKSLPTNDCSRRSESGAHQTSCDLHSCCFAMVLTAGFGFWFSGFGLSGQIVK